MNTESISFTETESDRQRRLNELVAENGPSWFDGFQPGSFGCHELLDRTSLLGDQIEEWLMNHPSCLNQPDWFALAEQAASALRELYHRVGTAHVDAQNTEAEQVNGQA
jgi:hypothetical protein